MKELKTITQSKLYAWEQNRNMQNVFKTENLENYILQHYKDFWSGFKVKVSSRDLVSFTKAWVQYCDKYWNILHRSLKNEKVCTDEQANKIANKFRGNVGEILAEYILTEFGSYIDKTTYDPVDPSNERFVDAFAQSKDGVDVNIQVKNFSGELDYLAFYKLAMEGLVYLYKNPDKSERFLKRPRQVLLTFTNTVFSKNEADYRLVVNVIGPSEIDSFFSNKDYDAWVDACDCILDNLENAK